MLTSNKIYEIDILKGLSKIDNSSIDIIICDPPYSISGNMFGNKKDSYNIDEYVIWSKKWMDECVRVLKDTGTIFIYGFSEILSYLSVNLSLDKRWLIWHYTNKNSPKTKTWQRSHESIIYAWKGQPIFNLDDIRTPYTKQYLKCVGKKRKGGTSRYGGKDTIYKANNKGAFPRDVINIPALAGGAGKKERYFLSNNNFFINENVNKFSNIIKHPTQKPFKLTETLLKSAYVNDGKVLIPFVGSGSELIICKKLNLNFIGFEINSDYVKLANKAIENYSKFNF